MPLHCKENILILATSNQGKLVEFQHMLSDMNVKILSTSDFPYNDPEETGKSFAENALLKANNACKILSYPVIADDSGFVVEAMDGGPGIYSARFALNTAQQADYPYAMQKILQIAKEKNNWNASFEAVIAFMSPDGTQMVFHGKIEGRLAPAPQGQSGFGYDPIFIPNGYDRSFC